VFLYLLLAMVAIPDGIIALWGTQIFEWFGIVW
jgi:hypothetical protein